MNSLESTAKLLYKNGYSTLLVEFSGFGLAYKYKASEANIYSDSTEIIHYVQKKYNYKKEQTFIFGWSLGTAVAIEMVKRKLGSKLLLIAPMTSMPDLVHNKFIPVLPYFVLIDRFSSKNKAVFIKEPVLIIHGTNDRMVPFIMGIELNKIFMNSELITLKNAGHIDILNFIDKNMWNKILKFLN
jgi:pimeloyl-ACP methyl ester carboxylesterase